MKLYVFLLIKPHFFLRNSTAETSMEADIIKGFFFPSRGPLVFEELGDP